MLLRQTCRLGDSDLVSRNMFVASQATNTPLDKLVENIARLGGRETGAESW